MELLADWDSYLAGNLNAEPPLRSHPEDCLANPAVEECKAGQKWACGVVPCTDSARWNTLNSCGFDGDFFSAYEAGVWQGTGSSVVVLG